jgi:Tfp pilus assembly protein PilF
VPDWTAARIAALRAVEVAQAGAADAATRRHAADTLARLEAGLEAAKRREARTAAARRLGTELQRIRLVRSQRRDLVEMEQAYRRIFAGLAPIDRDGPLDALETAIVESEAREELVLALDNWCLALLTVPSPGVSRKRLTALAGRVDPNPFRRQAREVWDARDRAALEKLAARPEVLDLPAGTIELMASSLTVHGNPAAGVALIRRVQARHPGDFYVNSMLGSALTRTDPPDFAEARVFATAAVACSPGSPIARVNLAYVLHELELLPAARSEAEAAVRLDPDFAEAHVNLGTILHQLGDHAGAERHAREAVRLAPGRARSHHNLGLALRALGRPEEAERSFREAVRLGPRDALLHYALGWHLWKAGRPGEAVA